MSSDKYSLKDTGQNGRSMYDILLQLSMLYSLNLYKYGFYSDNNHSTESHHHIMYMKNLYEFCPFGDLVWTSMY